jgi:hypothetical protein
MLVSDPDKRISALDVEDCLKDRFPEEIQGIQNHIKRGRCDENDKTSN